MDEFRTVSFLDQALRNQDALARLRHSYQPVWFDPCKCHLSFDEYYAVCEKMHVANELGRLHALPMRAKQTSIYFNLSYFKRAPTDINRLQTKIIHGILADRAKLGESLCGLDAGDFDLKKIRLESYSDTTLDYVLCKADLTEKDEQFLDIMDKLLDDGQKESRKHHWCNVTLHYR